MNINKLPPLLLGIAGGLLLMGARKVVQQLREFKLKGKVAVITGGSRGLGLVLARQLVDKGARVVICARHQDELQAAREELQERGGDVLAIRCDICEQLQVNQMIDIVEDHFGGIDLLINNAGVIQVGPMESMEIEDYQMAMNTHYWGTLYTCLAAIPGMRRRGTGHIVNVTSVGGKISFPHLLPYNASKFAVVGLSQGLRAELAKDGIVVTTVCPGLIRTGSHINAVVKGDHRREFAWFSILDTFPLTSTSAESTAAQIIEATRQEKAEIIISPQARLVIRLHDLAPTLVQNVLELVNRLLPRAKGGDQQAYRGAESTSSISPSFLTALGDEAALKNNELLAAG